jgi:hypothetical protein
MNSLLKAPCERSAVPRLIEVLSLVVIFSVGLVTAAGFLDSHIVWEHSYNEFRRALPESAVIDTHGTLWVITRGSDQRRLLRIDSGARLLDSQYLPSSVSPEPPSDSSNFHLIILSDGRVGLLVDYSHGGRDRFFDGAKFGVFDIDGKLGALRRVAGPGPWNNSLVSLDDGYFLILGDQAPMRISRVSASGDVVWHKDFSQNWVGPSGAAMQNGSACIASENYGANGMHLLLLGRTGFVQRRLDINAREGTVSTGWAGACVLLHGQSKDLANVDLSLTSFDSTLQRQWTTHVTGTVLWGAPYHLLTVSDGYIVCTDVHDGLLVMKFNFAGQVVWSGVDSTRHAPSLAVPFRHDFYFIRFPDVVRGA